MLRLRAPARRSVAALAVSGTVAVALTIAAIVVAPVLLIAAVAGGLLTVWLLRGGADGPGPAGGLAVDEIERLRPAEGALPAAATTEAAARELSKHAMVLLDAPAAVVLIETVG